MRIQDLRVRIHSRPMVDTGARQLEIDVTVNGQHYTRSQIVYENDLCRFFDEIFNRARDEIRDHIMKEAGV